MILRRRQAPGAVKDAPAPDPVHGVDPGVLPSGERTVNVCASHVYCIRPVSVCLLLSATKKIEADILDAIIIAIVL